MLGASLLSERGSVKAFRAKWTEPDPDNPGQRRTRTASTWTYRFEWRCKRHVGAENYKSKREALDAGEKRKAEVVRGMEADPHRTTFAVLDRLLVAESATQTRVTSLSTLANLARLRKVFTPDERLAEIGRTRIVEALVQLRELGLQDSTVRLTLRHLKRAMDLAFEERLIFAVPRFPKVSVQVRQQTIQPHELEAILANLPEHWVRYYLVADEIGWRARSEIRTRKWTDVDFAGGWIHLDAEHAKTGKARSFPMTERLRSLLTEQRVWIEALQVAMRKLIPWVFAGPNGEQIGDPRKAWASATVKAGFGRLEGRTGPWSAAKVAHDIRRTVLRRWSASGESLDVRMAAAGHDSSAVHTGYVGGDEASLRAFAERIDEARRNEAEKVTAIRKG